MSTKRIITVELVRGWLWRCEGDGIQVNGAGLWRMNPESGHLVPLTQDTAADTVAQEDLRHGCGSGVIALWPLAGKLAPRAVRRSDRQTPRSEPRSEPKMQEESH